MATAASTDTTKSTPRTTRKAPSKTTKSKAATATAAKATSKPTAKTAVRKATPAKRAAKAPDTRSRDTSASGSEHNEHVDRIWELAKRIGIAMFVTWDGKRQRARPLAATVEKDEGVIYFLTDVKGEKDDQIAEYPMVSVTFADHKSSKYVALAGRADILNDRAKIEELWSPFAKAWWDNPEDPSIRVIKMTPQDAELWDSPGRIVTTISMLAAAVTGRSPQIGENAKVIM